ncbi:MAG: DUF1501 domain-containing protein [Actinobacteria bacterium]|nr:DUF1501 domain-containing protein [Actinomycetota bacterium]
MTDIECTTCEPARGISRRTVLRGMAIGAAVAGVSSALGPFGTRVAWAATPGYTGDTLVILSLRGGFDAMSAIVPAADPDYYRLRPSIAIPAARTLPIDSRFGLHPALAPLTPLIDAGHLGFVHAVGLPAPNRSHFDAMDELEQAAPGSALRTGWLDRMLALHDPDGPFGAVQMGSSTMPYSLAGSFPALGMDSLDGFSLHAAWDAASTTRWSNALTALHTGAGAALKESATGTLGALATTAALASAANAPTVTYPDTNLGHALSDAGRLIRGNKGARVITIDEGDWDMHAGMGTVDGGWMVDHLTDLGACLAAFAADLGSRIANVTLLTITEFGRRASENESQGLDHGWGSAMMLLGGGVVPGVHGSWPGLSDAALNDGDLAVTTDYRAVLADVLTNRCGASTSEVASVLPGFTGATLGVTRARA